MAKTLASAFAQIPDSLCTCTIFVPLLDFEGGGAEEEDTTLTSGQHFFRIPPPFNLLTSLHSRRSSIQRAKSSACSLTRHETA